MKKKELLSLLYFSSSCSDEAVLFLHLPVSCQSDVITGVTRFGFHSLRLLFHTNVLQTRFIPAVISYIELC